MSFCFTSSRAAQRLVGSLYFMMLILVNKALKQFHTVFFQRNFLKLREKPTVMLWIVKEANVKCVFTALTHAWE